MVSEQKDAALHRQPHAQVSSAAAGGAAAAPDAKRSPSKHARHAVERLLQELSLDEKVGLMSTASPAINRTGSDGQQISIPAFAWWAECGHGAVVADDVGATIFPQPIALAATFDRRLVGAVGAAIGAELRAKSNEAEAQGLGPRMTNCFAPNINLFRDPRWGRGSETFGEDPTLAGELAGAFVRGLQGSHRHRVQAGATCKHFAAYSFEEWEGLTRHEFDARLDPRDARDAYLPAFEACVAAGQPLSIMCSYNAVNGTPACANDWLLGHQLRGRMHFDGLVVSDCGAIEDITDTHGWSATRARGAAAALKAGTDLACQDYSPLREALQRGLVREDDVDTAVRRLLLARFAMGHFREPHEDDPFRRIAPSVVGSDKHLALAREAAASSLVLLKNDPPCPVAPPTGGAQWAGRHSSSGCKEHGAAPLLPLHLGGLRRIAVIGPFANRSEYLLGSGGYYSRPAGRLRSPFQAVEERVGGTAELELVTGTEVMGQGADVLHASDACQRSDVCIFFVGTSALSSTVVEVQQYGGLPVFSPVVEAEGWDRKHLGLPGRQLNLIQGVARRTRTPLVVVLVHGAPLDVEWLQHSPRVAAILSAWTPGQGAAAIADVLFGDASPSGRLPVTFHFSNFTAQSDFGDMSMRRWPGRTHRHLQVPVLYPFGHGLSYTTFLCSQPTVEAASAAGGEAAGADADPLGAPRSGCFRPSTAPVLHVTVNISNVGTMAARETALLMLSYAGPELRQQQRCLGAWWAVLGPLIPARWRCSSSDGASSPVVSLLSMPCTPVSPGSSPSDLPVQTLAGFEKISLEAGQSGVVRIGVAARQWVPFSPLAGSGMDDGAHGSDRCSPPPYCGTYVLRVGEQQVQVELGTWYGSHTA